MAAPELGVPVPMLREAVVRRVRVLTQRAVATEIGMSVGWVDSFLAGREPRPATRRLLTEWYLRISAEEGQRLSGETARAALALLLEDVPARERDQVREDVLRRIEEGCTGGKAPAWVREVRRDGVS